MSTLEEPGQEMRIKKSAAGFIYVRVDDVVSYLKYVARDAEDKLYLESAAVINGIVDKLKDLFE